MGGKTPWLPPRRAWPKQQILTGTQIGRNRPWSAGWLTMGHMNTEERRKAVEEILTADPQASGRSVAKRLGCSQASIRRDIAWLRRESRLAQPAPEPLSSQVRSPDAQRIIAALDAELAESAKQAGHDLVWSAAEADVIAMIGAQIDRRVELSAQYEACGKIETRLKIAVELRLLEVSISRLYRQVSTEAPAPMSITSLKAQRAANSRWTRERMNRAN